MKNSIYGKSPKLELARALAKKSRRIVQTQWRHPHFWFGC